MEDLARLVADSLARHGYDAPVDHRRLEWSRWFRCDSTSFLLVPSSAGIYALGEELGATLPMRDPSDLRGSSDFNSSSASKGRGFSRAEQCPINGGALPPEVGASTAPSAPAPSKRMLAVFEIADTDDLGAALSRLFAPGHPLRDRLASGRCFARYSRVADRDQRTAASSALRQWLASSIEVATGFHPVDGAAGVLARPAQALTPPQIRLASTHPDRDSKHSSREATAQESPARECGEQLQIPVTRPQPEPSPQAPIATTSKVALRRSPPPLPAGF